MIYKTPLCLGYSRTLMSPRDTTQEGQELGKVFGALFDLFTLHFAGTIEQGKCFNS
jgi:hypothetical protein